MSLSQHTTAGGDNKLPAIAAVAFAGVATGCLAFVSAVDVRSFLVHVENAKTDLLRDHFRIWWPNGRDLIVPVLLGGLTSNFWAFRVTGDVNFAYAAGLLGCIGPYTGIVLGEDIEALRGSSGEEVKETAERFCRLHHLRLVASALGFGLSLMALAEL